MRDPGPEHAAEPGAEHGRHRVPVDEHQRAPAAGAEGPPQLPALTGEPCDHGREPTRDVALRLKVAAVGPVPEPKVRGGEPELLEQRRDLLHLLGGGHAHVGVAALPQTVEHRRQLDQLARRPVDDADHLSGMRRALAAASSAAPRHMPAPCAAT